MAKVKSRHGKSRNFRKLFKDSRRIALLPAMSILLVGGAANAQLITTNTSLSGNLDGSNAGGFLIQSGTLTVTNGTVQNFSTTGGTGSGGGAGMGGAFFVNDGARLVLNGVSFSHNSAIGGQGGSGTLGGVMNAATSRGLLTSSTAGSGTNGILYPDTEYFFGDGKGNGVPGTNGGAGGNATAGFGGTGGTGGAGGAGWSSWQIGIANVVAAGLATGAAAANIVAVAADIAAATANPLTANIAIGKTASVVAAALGLGSAIAATVVAGKALDAWNQLSDKGFAGNGGNGATGGGGGAGSDFFGGGQGGTGGAGGAKGSQSLAVNGTGGTGGVGGAGGFGAGGGAGGFGGASGGSGGAGGAAGFGGGAGSTGDGASGGGGWGMGGSVFVRSGGMLTVTGSGATGFGNAAGGASLNGGLAGNGVGTDLFVMTGATVNLAPGAGQTYTFNGTIADDSIVSVGTGQSQAPGNGADLRFFAGTTVLNGANTYSGQSIILGGALEGPLNTGTNTTGAPDWTRTGGVLRATDGVGLPTSSNLNFAGPGLYTGGALETSGTFARYLGTNSNRVQWTGSGGFAAFGGALTVTLNNGGALAWGGGNFVSFGSSLMFGSQNATNRVTFTNAMGISGGTASILVANNGNAAADALITGVISGSGNLDIGGGGYNGTLVLGAANTYTGNTRVNAGATLALDANGSIGNTNTLTANGTFDISANAAGATVGALNGSGSVLLGARTLTIGNGTNVAGGGNFTGVVSGTGGVTLAAGNSQTLGGVNTFTGQTTLGASASLFLTSGNALATSSGVAVGAGALFDVSQAGPLTTIKALTGAGSTLIGSRTLALTAASGTYAGTIADGGAGGGSAGNLVVAAGTQTLTGTNSFTGIAATAAGATLALSGTGAIATAAQVLNYGTFDIAGTTGGASIRTLSGGPPNPANVPNYGALTPAADASRVLLGARTLTITNASTTYGGVISGTGALTISGGNQTLTGTNTYTGNTTINSGTTLTLTGTGGIAASAEVIDNGTFNIAGTSAGASIRTLSGSGSTVLGAQTLTFTAGSTTFAGVISGTGGIATTGGTQTLSGINTYTGLTTINPNSTLALIGTGSIATSVGVVDNGTFSIAGTTNGASIITLSGSGSTLLGARTLTLTNASGTYAGVASGTGGITIAAGTEVLTGVNTYTGATTVASGARLNLVDAGSVSSSSGVAANGIFDISGTTAGTSITTLSGSGSTLLGARSLTFTAGSTTFSGSISGTGGITAAGGTQTLSGVNSFTGATAINSGATLALTGAGSIATSSGVTANGTFDISGTNAGASITRLAGTGAVVLGARTLTLTAANDTFSGVIGGTGGVAITGGTQTLSGTNTYSGGTSVTNATVVTNSAASLGAASGGLTLNGGTVRVAAGYTDSRAISVVGTANTINTQANTVTLSGVISGTGGWIASGGGTINLTANNTWTGGLTIIEATRVFATQDSAFGGAGNRIFLQPGSLVSLAGGVPITRDIFLVTGVNDPNPVLAFSDTTGVQGPVTIDGQRLIVEFGSSLRGVGTINTVTTIGGTLQPGNSPGTITFTAPVALLSTATYSVDVDGTGTGEGAGNYSRTLVTGAGNTFTAGGVLQPNLRGITGSATNTFVPPVTTVFNVVNAAGGVAGSFASLTQPASGLPAGTRFDAVYLPRDLNLYVTPADYRNLSAWSLGLTGNQAAVAGGLNAMRGTAGVRVDAAASTALDTLFRQQPARLPGLFNTLSGTIYGDMLMSGVNQARQFGASITDQGVARREGIVAHRATTADAGHGITAWIAGIGQNTRVGNAGNTGYGGSSGGFALGGEKRFEGGFTLGLAGGYSSGKVNSRGTAASADLDVGNFALYGGWTDGKLFVDAQAGMTIAEGVVRRTQSTFGTRATSSPSGVGANFGLDVGNQYQVSGWNLTPSLGIRVDQLNRDGVTERGAGALSLGVRSDDVTSARTMVGGRASTSLQLGEGYTLTPSARLYLAHEFGDANTMTTASFSNGASTPAMAFRTAPVGRTGAVGGFGASLSVPGGAEIYLNYGADVRSNANTQALSGGVRFTW